MERQRPHIVLLDLRLPDASGFDLIPRIHRVENSTQIIVITAFGDTKAAVQAMKLGASDFLRKPYDLDELILAVETASRDLLPRRPPHASTGARIGVSTTRTRSSTGPRRWRGSGTWCARWPAPTRPASSSPARAGPGKELVARGVHFEGARRRAPFMELNCSAFQETLLENELFGHERGAFTGASYLKRGLVELSDGGTLFLDEVGEMPIQTQAKLLRFLEDRSLPAGRRKCRHRRRHPDRGRHQRRPGPADRGGAVPHRPLLPAPGRLDPPASPAGAGRRREPAGRVLPAASSPAELRKSFPSIDEEVRAVFRSYDWPGNVRELRNLIERIVLDRGRRGPSAAAPSARNAGPRSRRPQSAACFRLARTRRRGAAAATDLRVPSRGGRGAHPACARACEGNKSQAARILGLSRQGLLDRLKRGRPSALLAAPILAGLSPDLSRFLTCHV